MKKALLPIFAAFGLLALVAAFVFVYVSGNSGDEDAAAGDPSSAGPRASTVSADSHYLDEAGADAVTVVEFLDFECGACGTFYPYVEELRKEYRGQINYVVRYLPLPIHPNSMTAAVAAEAAAEQGEFEAMYQRLFETQQEWAGSSSPQSAFFRELAVQLGLDMTAYDAAVTNPQTQARVQEDFDAAVALDVGGTPTFFVNDEPVDTQRLEDLPDAIDTALEG